MNIKTTPERGRNICRMDYNPGIQEFKAFEKKKKDLRFHFSFRIIVYRGCLSDILAHCFLSSKLSSKAQEKVLLIFYSKILVV